MFKTTKNWLCLSPVAVFVLANLLPTSVAQAQDWRDPEMQQPVQQYYSPQRYSPPSPGDVARPGSGSMTSGRYGAGAQNPATGRDANRPPEPTVTKSKKPPVVEKQPQRFATKNWDIYRDHTRYPMDPRKPTGVCKHSGNGCQCGTKQRPITGSKGAPWQDREPGGMGCGDGKCGNRPQRADYSVYWPKPRSAKRNNRQTDCQACGCQGCSCRKINDWFDHLAHFTLIDYQRKDNGYRGFEADPYGCLGESRSRVAGIGFQTPSEPVSR